MLRIFISTRLHVSVLLRGADAAKLLGAHYGVRKSHATLVAPVTAILYTFFAERFRRLRSCGSSPSDRVEAIGNGDEK
jgi:hypothetical protein